jgi:hypothetical protein
MAFAKRVAKIFPQLASKLSPGHVIALLARNSVRGTKGFVSKLKTMIHFAGRNLGRVGFVVVFKRGRLAT